MTVNYTFHENELKKIAHIAVPALNTMGGGFPDLLLSMYITNNFGFKVTVEKPYDTPPGNWRNVHPALWCCVFNIEFPDEETAVAWKLRYL